MKRLIMLFVGIVLLISLVGLATPSLAQTTIRAWSPNTLFKVGDLVTYNGHAYKCLVTHTSQVGWEPSVVAVLWQDLGVTSITSIADSYTQAYAPTFNNGTVRGLGVSQGQMVGTAYSYLKFDLSRVWGTVKSAQLSLCGTKVSWSQDVWTALYTTSNNTWLENTITWDNEPTLVSWLSVTKVSGLAAYKWTVPVTLINQRTSQVLSFALRVDARTVGDANAVFTSKEYLGSCQPGYPTLLLQY